MYPLFQPRNQVLDTWDEVAQCPLCGGMLIPKADPADPGTKIWVCEDCPAVVAEGLSPAQREQIKARAPKGKHGVGGNACYFCGQGTLEYRPVLVGKATIHQWICNHCQAVVAEIHQVEGTRLNEFYGLKLFPE